MAHNEAKRQKKLLKKRQKDKLRRKAQAEAVPYSALSAKKKIHLARQYPLHECLINRSWMDQGLAYITVSRRQPNGALVFGVYLVDILCLGLKNTLCNADLSRSRYKTDLVERVYRNDEPIPCSPDLAHYIIYGAIDYARQFGFEPQRDFELSQHVLDERGSLEAVEGVEFGRAGKPFFIAGPDDNVQRIIKQLESTAGRDQFGVLYGGDPPAPHLSDYSGQTT
jgi:hypothetical protein